MKRQFLTCVLFPSLLFAGGCALDAGEETNATTTLGSSVTTDVDFAPECEGIITYANWATPDELNYFLPAAVAQNFAAHRQAHPFTSIADISSVPGIAASRLAQIWGRAITYDFIDVECSGIYEELAVSYPERVAILAFVNQASEAELTAAVRFEPEKTVTQLIAGRPFTRLQAIADTYGVGPATFRSLRDAATH